MHRLGWLRPAVLGANDGIVSIASLILGVDAASADRHGVLLAGFAGLVAGAMSMAAGEYVSVSSQADLEAAGLATERAELAADPQAEEGELAAIYVAWPLKVTPQTIGQKLRGHCKRTLSEQISCKVTGRH